MKRVCAAAAVAAAALLLAGCGSGPAADPPPEVQGTATVTFSPAPGAVGVRPDVRLQLLFSRPMDTALTAAAVRIRPAVACSFSWQADATELTCSPAEPLAASTTYTVSVGSSARTRDGLSLSGVVSAGFTSAAGTSPAAQTCIFDTARFDDGCLFGP